VSAIKYSQSMVHQRETNLSSSIFRCRISRDGNETGRERERETPDFQDPISVYHAGLSTLYEYSRKFIDLSTVVST